MFRDAGGPPLRNALLQKAVALTLVVLLGMMGAGKVVARGRPDVLISSVYAEDGDLVAAPTPSAEPTTQIFLPGVSGGQTSSQPQAGGVLWALQRFLNGYGAFVLLLLALLALFLLRRKKQARQGDD
jgi:hypothetical protein